MATVRKTLGQVNPAATTDTDLYTVPAATDTVVSSIVFCNQAAVAGTFQLRVRVAGAAAVAKQLLAKDVAIAANSLVTLTLGITLATTDVITVQTSSATMSVSAFGQENT